MAARRSATEGLLGSGSSSAPLPLSGACSIGLRRSRTGCTSSKPVVAYLNIDEVIRIIRKDDKPRMLMKPSASVTLRRNRSSISACGSWPSSRKSKFGGAEGTGEGADSLQQILKSATKLKNLIRDELLALAEKHGDARRTAIVEREAAQAIAETTS